MKYVYTFDVWPDETSPKWPRAVFDLWRIMRHRIEMTFTESEFGDFREELAKVGLTLRGIVRRPNVEFEAVC